MPIKSSQERSLSALIREYFESHPNAGPTQVVRALAEKKIVVSLTLVSNVKARMRRGAAIGVRGRLLNRQSVSISALLEAKRFADHVGSVQAAINVLNTLSKLR